jgi:arabinan endo-1,5-alpha-L-arabinosidase
MPSRKMKRAILFLLLIVAGKLVVAQELRIDISVHDPVMIKQDSVYYLFCTGQGISMWSSVDMVHWKAEKQIFEIAPAWVQNIVPGFKNHIWAPDISYYLGQYYLYYAVSAFGKNTSGIGLATNPTLHTDDPAYQWTDHGLIIQSKPGETNWNAIDPNLVEDKDGTPYLAFGSFWEGLKIVRLRKDRMGIEGQSSNLPTIATRVHDPSTGNPAAVDGNPSDAGGNAIEAPFIFRKGKYFYLFASIDYCCKGPKSTYKMIVGRSKNVQGPYLDKNGLPMSKGAGTLLLEGDRNWYGVGHNAVCDFGGIDYLIFHGYDAHDHGISKLRIEKLEWQDGWPVVTKYNSK